MVEQFSVVPDDLGRDAEVWRTWAERLTAIADAVPTIGEGLQLTDFSALPGAPEVAASYRSVSTSFTSELKKGAETMQGIADKLDTVAENYNAAEERNVADLTLLPDWVVGPRIPHGPF